MIFLFDLIYQMPKKKLQLKFNYKPIKKEKIIIPLSFWFSKEKMTLGWDTVFGTIINTEDGIKVLSKSALSTDN